MSSAKSSCPFILSAEVSCVGVCLVRLDVGVANLNSSVSSSYLNRKIRNTYVHTYQDKKPKKPRSLFGSTNSSKHPDEIEPFKGLFNMLTPHKRA